jgi:hypothetical protein
VKPGANSSSSVSTITKSRIESETSMLGETEGVQARECGSLGITLQCSFWRSVAKKL